MIKNCTNSFLVAFAFTTLQVIYRKQVDVFKS